MVFTRSLVLHKRTIQSWLTNTGKFAANMLIIPRNEKSHGSLAEYRWQGNGGADGISQWENALAGTMLKHRPHFGEKDGFRGLVEKD